MLMIAIVRNTRPSHRFTCHRCEQPLRVVRPAHRLGDGAGRSPGSRVVALRPAFPVSQWPLRTKGSPLTVAGAATAASRCREPVRVPSCLLGLTEEPARRKDSAIGAGGQQDERTTQRNCARCGTAATESASPPWHSGPACGLLGAPHAGCRDPRRLRILPATQYSSVSTRPAWTRTSDNGARMGLRAHCLHPASPARGVARPECPVAPAGAGFFPDIMAISPGKKYGNLLNA
jgi:hypothetical protein